MGQDLKELEEILDKAVGELNNIIPKSAQSISRAYTMFSLYCKDETSKGVMFELLNNIKLHATLEQINEFKELSDSATRIAKS